MSSTQTQHSASDPATPPANYSAIFPRTTGTMHHRESSGVVKDMTNPDTISQAEAEAGTATTDRLWTAERVAQAIAALGTATSTNAQQVVDLTASNNFNSAAATNIPGLTLTVPAGEGGDYIFYTLINTNNDADECNEVTFAVNGTTETDSLSCTQNRKNKDDCIHATYLKTGVVAGDVITAQINTRSSNVDLVDRRLLIWKYA